MPHRCFSKGLSLARRDGPASVRPWLGASYVGAGSLSRGRGAVTQIAHLFLRGNNLQMLVSLGTVATGAVPSLPCSLGRFRPHSPRRCHLAVLAERSQAEPHCYCAEEEEMEEEKEEADWAAEEEEERGGARG